MKPEEGAGSEPQVRVVDRRWWAREDAPAADQPAASLKPTYVEDLERRLSDVTHQLQSALTDRRQALDEFEQVKSRLRRDTAKEVERGRRAVLVELLDVVDNLERALAAGRDAAAAGDPGGNDRVGGFARGVELVRDQFLAKLGSFGVQRVPAIGTPFDAARHDAVTTTPVDDAAMDGIIMAVIKDGYAVGDDVLRPAAVVVGRKN